MVVKRSFRYASALYTVLVMTAAVIPAPAQTITPAPIPAPPPASDLAPAPASTVTPVLTPATTSAPAPAPVSALPPASDPAPPPASTATPVPAPATIPAPAPVPAPAAELAPPPPTLLDLAGEAEEQKDWSKAVSLYRQVLAKQPARYDLWERIADIEATRNKPVKAEAAIKNALKIKPHNAKLLARYAQLAEWAGDTAIAEQSYRAVLQLKPQDDKSRFALATVLSWEGKTKESISFLEPYAARHPHDRKALLLLSQLYMWNGDFDKSSAALENYKKVAGEDKDYKKVKMLLLANENKNADTVKSADAVLQEQPKDCDAFTSKATALGAMRQPAPMLESLKGAGEYCKDKAAAAELDRKLTAPLRSNVRGDFTWSTDSDTVEIGTYTLDGRYQINSKTYLLMGAETGWLQASATSGFNTVQGQSRIDQSAVWAGVEKMISSVLWLTGRLGYHEAGNSLQTTPTAHGAAEYRPSDSLTLNYDISRDFYSVSPRAVSEGIKLTDNQLLGSWHINQGNTFDMKADYGFLSDNNSYWTALLSPRHNVFTGKKLSVDIGVSAQETGFSKTLTDGYYSPTSYSEFLVNADISYAFNSDDKIGLLAGTGINKDNTMTGYRRADNIAVEGSFGLYKDWMLNAHAGHSDSIGINSAQYRVEDYTANLTRRF